ncbi:flagellar hook assembly protein FlgD [Thiorhodococcus mannitoliphagus]|uniref:Basal-body rod modification protein FlgD n=1 Tax=Thiorhodococcus mannitoliphagus TaxID=329406 RepID=A0A6P1DY52_9GAMM|nr:flagellar hook assembly protein FlgD [Thiorhodococcus mannitoliphagus]NEX21072.1 flagellar hook assembly protein FlgD [Thiorhodococcus mannitoliphagus]
MTQITSDYISGLGLSSYGDKAAETEDDSLGQDEFLTLMIAQIKNQDPTNPVQNEDFVAQLAQFSTVSGIEGLNSSFEDLAQTLSQNQTLQAASLVGNRVLVPAQTAELSEGQGLTGAVNLSSSAGSAALNIYGPGGALVRTQALGSLSAGLQEFSWDGLLDDGSPAPAGAYTIEVTAQTDGATEALDTMIDAEVQSVTTDNDGGGLLLSLLGIGTVSFSDVYRIG